MTRTKGVSEIIFGKVTEKNVEQLQRLNTALFPVRYNEKFYRDAIAAPEGFVQLAYYQGVLVGAVLVRKEARIEGGEKLYIMTLGVLAPYRERGIGNQLLNHVFELCRTSKLCQNVQEIYLHVHTANEEAIQFYKKRGFGVVETIEHYYKRGVEPPNCYLLSKKLDDTPQSKQS
eukprot:Plantae.Rhodophyta-Purpureofilum_apyrenoidigerum.ctg16460.p1 GENE.Plantae.Rhodophyta-Purpureofilum_apyrenoidigerum.ctg16460~~Plantae.Rhodophyta-Purpureofilum_apyrenoidigerum.ctg16460.p1  ORF type:complete len:174 (+),score=27.11 Plantae.Rhodophyta-Purpureofilum_apyrenoidigerum.ctg16460:226-747(+)